MNMLKSPLSAAYDDLASLARKNNFWDIFQDVFGLNYNSVLADAIRRQWQEKNFSQLPGIVVTTTSVLGVANAAYAKDRNTIYVSERFLAIATQNEVRAVLLEEIGHYVDALVNGIDTKGDEGELFSLRARGLTPTARELQRITAENDSGTIVDNGQAFAVEQAVPVVYESVLINKINFNNSFSQVSDLYQISGLNAAWSQNSGSNIILYLYNGVTRQAIANDAYAGSMPFDISGGTVVYAKKGDIYRYSAGVTTQLTSTTNFDYAPVVDGSTIAWKGWGTTSNEVFRRVGTTNVQLTNNAFEEESMQLSGSNLLWAAWDGTDYDIFLNNGTTTIALTSNATDDYDPVISGNRVAWFNWTGTQTNLWYYNGTASSQITTGEEVLDVVLCGNNLAYVALNPASSTYSIKFYNTTTKAFTTLANDLIVQPTPASLQSSSTWIAWIEFKALPTGGTSSQLKLFDGSSTLNIGTPNAVSTFKLVGKRLVYSETATSGLGGTSSALFLYDGSGTTPSTTQLTSFESSSLPSSLGGFLNLDIVGNQILRESLGFSNTLSSFQAANSLLLTKPTTKPILSAANVKVVEGLTSPQSVNVTVTLSAASVSTVSVKYETSTVFSGSFAAPGSDYTATTGTLVFAPGQTTTTVSIPILDDTFSEPDKTFQLVLKDPVNAVVAPGLDRATVTITDTLEQTGTAGQTFVLPNGVENLKLTGTTSINGTGNASDNIITGNSGNNILNGGGGFFDQLIGGLGNDTYMVTQPLFFSTTNPPIKEDPNQGLDTVQAVASNSFGNITLPDNVEDLLITGTSTFSFTGTGNDLANQITGNLGSNFLDGRGGIDTVNYSLASAANAAVSVSLLAGSASGGGGFDSLFGFENVVGSTFDDTIAGDNNANTLRGHRGSDTLTGLGGIDKFDYRILTESLLGAANNAFDRITDLNAAVGGDRVLVPVARAGFLNAGAVTTLDSAGLAAKLTAGAFLGNFAASFTFGTGPALRTFMAINDATAGFSATTDAIVEVTGLAGTLGIANFATA
jgi:hypothetical protein